jgi:hypothetical protein
MVVAPVPAAPPASGIVTTGFGSSCVIDWRGIERCY